MATTMLVDDIPIERCAYHTHIRECFTTEMDRYMADRETRFLDGTAISHHDLDNDQPVFPDCLNVHTAGQHDPRMRTMVENFMVARLSIPMGIDADSLPVLCSDPATSTSASLDAIESARLVMSQKVLANVRVDQSHAAVQKVIDLAFATVSYVKALHRLYDQARDRDRSRDLDQDQNSDRRAHSASSADQRRILSLRGLITAYETERSVLCLARQLVRDHQKNTQRARVIAAAVDERMRLCRLALAEDEDEQATINKDDLTAAAIASHAKCLHVTMARDNMRHRQQEEEGRAADRENAPPLNLPIAALLAVLRTAPRITRPRRLVLQSEGTQTCSAATSDAVVKYVAAEHALQAMRQECRVQGLRIPNIQFHIYPVRHFGRMAVSFYTNARPSLGTQTVQAEIKQEEDDKDC
ncbi:hypothetical protein SPBR_05048 [Sporothrix brasiliensis 5110]|uniref:Uncharacterized protein n=1 Tax=Sporothrix brasiliensis 5110 TaxID=1398154 RepID=A0A0C2IKI6_9PEZI|nr:uncharacterized protein SPBR_05048 [Sporothrix brasiliensis 5110]KIH87495.1 hypothetical protein SPBR_05048 [Sporothrix brasiliensis 5110]